MTPIYTIRVMYIIHNCPISLNANNLKIYKYPIYTGLWLLSYVNLYVYGNFALVVF